MSESKDSQVTMTARMEHPTASVVIEERVQPAVDQSDSKNKAPASTSYVLPDDALLASSKLQWHSISTVEDVLLKAGTRRNGLSSQEAQRRLAILGPNRMTPPKGKSAWKRLFEQINSILIYILVAAGVASLVFEHYIDAGVIFAVVVINVAIGFLMEGKAEKAAQSLTKVLANEAHVVRDHGALTTISADQLTVGDIVRVKAGESAPADLRLIEAANAQVEEAMLTGESAAVAKSTGPLSQEAALADRTNMMYSGTSLLFGTVKGVVVAVGDACEVGKINTLVGSVATKQTPLLVQLTVLGRWVSLLIFIIGLVSFGIAMLRDYEVSAAFNNAVGIAVAAIPEGLPSVITVILGIGVRKMAKHNAIVRQLPSVETLGSVSVICSDKTGTLTQNAMTVVALRSKKGAYRVSGSGYNPIGDIRFQESHLTVDQRRQLLRVVLPGMLCNDSSVTKEPEKPGFAPQWKLSGNPTEGALLTLGMKIGLDDLSTVSDTFPRVATLPFDSQYKFMATLNSHSNAGGDTQSTIRINPDTVSHQTMEIIMRKYGGISPGSEPHAESKQPVIIEGDDLLFEVPTTASGDPGRVLLLKGAPDVVLPFCSHQLAEDEQTKEDIDVPFWRAQAAELASEGLRVLALCSAVVEVDRESIDVKDITHAQAPFLTLHCLVGILDPPREQAITAVSECQRAGIRVIMITGDHPMTACVIGQQLGIYSEDVLTGREVDAMGSEALQAAVKKTCIFARATPENKLRIVEALQHFGKVVAMTGDGVNDSPALKRADIGVAMGITGTHVAKAASNMILADDNFATIVEAVRRGRTVYDNLKKVLLFVLPTNGGQSFSILISLIIGLTVPIVPVQILWVNLITSITLGVVLAFDPEDQQVMARLPRRKGKRILGQLLTWRMIYVSLLLSAAVIISFQWELDNGSSIRSARTVAVNTLSVCQIAYIFNCRFMNNSSLHKGLITGNPQLFVGIVAVAGFQAIFTYVPGVQFVFETESHDGLAWLRCFLFAAVVFILVEIDKKIGPLIVHRVLKPALGHLPGCRKCPCFKRKEVGEPTFSIVPQYPSKSLGANSPQAVPPVEHV